MKILFCSQYSITILITDLNNLSGNITMVKPIYSCTPSVEQPKISTITPLVKTAPSDRLD